MKTAIKLTLLFSTGAFASIPARSNHRTNLTTYSQVSLVPLRHSRGFAIMVDKPGPGTAEVIIYHADKDVIFKDCLTKEIAAEKKYMTGKLYNGSYMVEVFSKGHDIKTNFSIYHNGVRRVEAIL